MKKTNQNPYTSPVCAEILLGGEDVFLNPSLHASGSVIDDTGEEQNWGEL